MQPDLKQDVDGGRTIHLQSTSPSGEIEANRVPVPDAPFYCRLHTYWPKEAILDG
jgi:hypothetical protein